VVNILSSGHYSASVDEFNDPAGWDAASSRADPVDILEPLSDIENPYSEYALIHLRLLWRVDEWMVYR
jgi:hypothetical protein